MVPNEPIAGRARLSERAAGVRDALKINYGIKRIRAPRREVLLETTHRKQRGTSIDHPYAFRTERFRRLVEPDWIVEQMLWKRRC